MSAPHSMMLIVESPTTPTLRSDSATAAEAPTVPICRHATSAAIRTTAAYKNLMALLRRAGINDRDTRLEWASRILRMDVPSFTVLNDDCISVLADAAHDWLIMQECRNATGALVEESLYITRFLAGECKELGDQYYTTTTQQQRQKIRRTYDMAAKKNDIRDMTTERDKALEGALAHIEKNFGKGAIMRLGEETRQPIQTISSGNTAIDIALGVGGFPRGRIIEVYGPESSGKTTVALHAIAQAQKNGGIAAFIDAEHALDPDYAHKLGVDTDALLVSQPDTGEQALEIADMLIRSGAISLIVVDSVAALTPQAEIEGDMGDSHVGLQARLMSQALRKMTGALYNSGTTAIFINQLREKIGVMFGSPETTTGGKALKFYASVRCDVRRIQTLKDGQDSIGNRTKLKVVKNKVAPPFKTAEFDIIYGEGISRESSIIDLGVEHGIVKKSGSWFTYNGDQLGQGKEKSRNYLKENSDLADEIEQLIFQKVAERSH